MKHTLAALMTTSALGVAGCGGQQVYGYCGQGDTCRYEGDRTVVVGTYSGFIEPGAAEFATIEASAAASVPSPGATDGAGANISAASVVTISN